MECKLFFKPEILLYDKRLNILWVMAGTSRNKVSIERMELKTKAILRYAKWLLFHIRK
jgi:hypothetical protein